MIWVNKLAPSCLVTYLQDTVISNKMRWNHRIFNCNVRGLLGVQTINESPPPTFYVKPQILGRVTFYFLDISYSTVPHFWAIRKYTPKRDFNKNAYYGLRKLKIGQLLTVYQILYSNQSGKTENLSYFSVWGLKART